MPKLQDCIIVAAGRSSRMKAWKPGLSWGDSTILETVVDQAREAGCRIVVVGGWRYRKLRRILSGRDEISIVRAGRWRKGMDESIRRGIREVSDGSFFVMPGDMPLVRASDYRRLFDETVDADAEAARPVWNGRPGHPVLLSGLAVSRIQNGRPGIPLREILRSVEVREIEWDHDGVVSDIDTPEAYKEKKP